MSPIKQSLIVLTWLFFSFLLAGCGGGGSGGGDASSGNQVSLSELSISPGSVSLAIDSSQSLNATGIYSDNSSRAVDDQVSWSSSDDATASVSAAGVVTANAAGTADITATLGSISQRISVTVSPATLQSISISSAVPQVPAGLSTQFSASGLYSDGTQQDLSDQVNWSVSDLTKATINASTGLLTGEQAGSVTVRATKEGLSASLAFTVSEATLTSLQATPATMVLAKGTSQSVTVTGIFSDNSNQNVSDQVTWTSSADSVADVSDNSLVTALLEGSATLTASLAGAQIDVPVSVTSAELVSLSLNPVNASVPLGRSQQYIAQGTYSDGSVQDLSSEVTWLSSDQDAAVIGNAATAKGRADTLATGSTTISAVLGDVQQSTTLTVTDAQLSTIELDPVNQTVANGSDATIRAYGQYSDGKRLDITSLVNWDTSSSGLIDLSSAANGTIKTLAQGEALVTAQLDGVTSLANISVTDATLSSITIEADSTTLADGTSLQLVARGLYSDNSTQDITDQVTWESGDISVLTVANNGDDFGSITGQSPGQANITATTGGVSGQESFTVTNAVLSSLLISSPQSSLNVNNTVQATAQATYTDDSTQNVTNQVNWSSSAVSTAAVDNTPGNKGQISALSVGDAQIIASLSGVQSNNLLISVTQDPDLPAALTVTPQPNIILNDDADASQININVIPTLPTGTIADGTDVNLTITEGEAQRTVSLTTTDGVASYTLTSSYSGVIGLSATLGDLSRSSGVLSTSDLRSGIVAAGLSQADFQDGTLKAGSVFLLLVRNISNRTFNIDEVSIQYLDPNNGNAVVQFPGSPYTSPEATSGGDLTGGELTSSGYQLDNDIEASTYQIIYRMSDDATGDISPFGANFNFAAP
ncbi:Ig-like domain-containing protein [Marinobacter sp. CHS3-4]|uniref:Ig-like domain-containing protein n=1 Tax=Marinobacter sp. CHS3-4 TaxID=3045174 RepID=UPI0024B50FEB|nr:Ig-like domain-containing protein [Marinobacter sp. CHS3-4]MDI9244644.1 Ig-like domain-containing protein [Marinobacter sp. CHS3-4]